MERSRQAEREPARVPQNVQVVFDADLREIEHPMNRMDDVSNCAVFCQQLHHGGHEAPALLGVMWQQEPNAQFLHNHAFTPATRPAYLAQPQQACPFRSLQPRRTAAMH